MALSLELNIILLVFLLVLSAFFSGVEIALFSLNKLRIKRLVKKGVKNAAELEKLKSDPNKLITTILIGNNVANISASAFATSIMLRVLPGEFAVGIVTGVLTFFVLVFGEITPKSIALKHPEKISLLVARPLLALQFVLSPLLWMLKFITEKMISLFGGQTIEANLTEDEIRSTVSIGAEEGAIKKEEKDWIHRIFRFNDIPVEQVMTKRAEIEAIPVNTKLSELQEFLEEKTFSRFPVFEGELDKIVGVFNLKDALPFLLKKKTSFAVKKLMRPALFVPPTKKIDKLFKEFKAKKTHIAIVVGEYGGVIGVVTMEDLLEEIVGEISDETDTEPKVKKISQKEFLVEGEITIEELNKLLETAFESVDFQSLGGLLLHKFDRIPKQGDKLEINEHLFEITKMDNQKIEQVKITKR